MTQQFALATPTTEEMARVAIVGGAAGGTGAVEGIALSMAPKLGGLELPFTWGTMLGTPVIGAAVALMTKGMISDLGLGIAAGGAAILGRELPIMLQEFTLAGRRAPAGSGQVGAGPGVKLLGAGSALNAPQRAQSRAAVGLEF
ncbi:unnamed protein product [marine sediment metagenome]|uniref:Uncharacterized protein n=1 Tax=marine sediment metagenome TaxID=412755 RepID=X1IS27_9ZZZZ